MSRYYGSTGSSNGVVETPEWLWQDLEEEFGELFDPCPIDPEVDGLEIDWPRHQTAYVNPPYARGHLPKWVKKCSEQAMRGCRVALLIPSYTDTKYWHRYIWDRKEHRPKENVELRFFRGRVNFKGYERSTASFPNVLIVWTPFEWRGFLKLEVGV